MSHQSNPGVARTTGHPPAESGDDRAPVTAFRPGSRLRDFLLPSRNGVPTSFYERYCGRPVLLCFAADAADLEPFAACARDCRIFGLVATARDPLPLAAADLIPDAGALAAALGEPLPGPGEGPIAWLLDATLRQRARFCPVTVEQVTLGLEECSTTRVPSVTSVTSCAPVLMIPDVLEPALCAALIAAHERDHETSGMRRMVDGRAVLVPDRSVKSRSDHRLQQPDLVADLGQRLATRVLPEIAMAFHYPVTRLEGWKVVCYDAADGGWFRPHRDNLAPDARHRRFALTVNLNDGYSGGALVFPEYGDMACRPPRGGAIVFSGSLLHELTPVTGGRRYALLSFLWGEEAVERDRSAPEDVRAAD
jgi:predicted 2-oxoglutarate/Fe(II)-dependent dioxygenase YbiX